MDWRNRQHDTKVRAGWEESPTATRTKNASTVDDQQLMINMHLSSTCICDQTVTDSVHLYPFLFAMLVDTTEQYQAIDACEPSSKGRHWYQIWSPTLSICQRHQSIAGALAKPKSSMIDAGRYGLQRNNEIAIEVVAKHPLPPAPLRAAAVPALKPQPAQRSGGVSWLYHEISRWKHVCNHMYVNFQSGYIMEYICVYIYITIYM